MVVVVVVVVVVKVEVSVELYGGSEIFNGHSRHDTS